MNIIKKAADFLKGKTENEENIDSAEVLSHNADPMVRNLGRALSEAIEGTFSSEERAMIDKIEGLRAKLLSSTGSVNVIDYGAGSRTDKRTEQEMYAGVPVSNTVSNICKTTSKPELWAQILFKIIRYTDVQKCIELGTSVGISGLYQGAALKLNGTGGVLKTMEGSPEVAAIARENFKSFGLENVSVIIGRFQDNLDELLKEGDYDYAFIDGHHDKDATIKYFEQIYPWFASQGLFVFDDIKWSDGMKQAWATIIADSRISVSIDMGPVGICVINKNTKEKKDFKVKI